MGLFDGIIAGVGSVAGSLIDARTAKRNTDRTIEANKEMAEYAYNKDLEMWNRGNEYNSPEAQMARLKGAGLNPNLVYGSGSPGGMSAGQLPKYNAPTAQYNYKPAINLPEMLSAFQDFKFRQAQTDNVKAQTEYVQSRAINEGLRKPLLESDAVLKKLGITGAGTANQQASFDLLKDQGMLGYDLEAKRLENEMTRKDIQIAGQKLLTMPEERARIKLEQDRARQQIKIQKEELARYPQRHVSDRLENKLKNLGINKAQWELAVKNPAEMAKLQMEIEKIQADKLWKENENAWRELGIQSSDSLPFRVLTRMYMTAMGMLTD